VRDPWSDRFGFWLWQAGTFIYVMSMLVQGVREGLDPTVLFSTNAGTSLLYGIRLFAGVLLLFANLRWLWLLELLRSRASEVGTRSIVATLCQQGRSLGSMPACSDTVGTVSLRRHS